MKYIRLGQTGMKVSRICFGCMSYGSKTWMPWIIEADEARAYFARVIEAGINFFDTSNNYSLGESERITGRYLKEMGRRNELVVATKVFGTMGPGPNQGGLSRKHIIGSCEDSLRRLGMDYIDLYQIHRWDYDVPIEETLGALDELVRAGKVRYLGASSMAAWQFSKAIHLARAAGLHRFVSMQNYYNLLYREEEREMIPLCVDEGVGLIPWSPLAGGTLARGSFQTTTVRSTAMQPRQSGDADRQIIDAVARIAAARGVAPAQVALSWVISAPGVTAPIVGATKLSQIEDALKALDLTLTDEEKSALEAPYKPRKIVGHPHPSAARMARAS
ncbi:MAG TPA: aldo/keto reductase [Candidatus Binataceae bacterium]|nr:aldo/keto reductase [Candidatus Binataceae bacterium]